MFDFWFSIIDTSTYFMDLSFVIEIASISVQYLLWWSKFQYSVKQFLSQEHLAPTTIYSKLNKSKIGQDIDNPQRLKVIHRNSERSSTAGKKSRSFSRWFEIFHNRPQEFKVTCKKSRLFRKFIMNHFKSRNI